jgi:hypothetical protein
VNHFILDIRVSEQELFTLDPSWESFFYCMYLRIGIREDGDTGPGEFLAGRYFQTGLSAEEAMDVVAENCDILDGDVEEWCVVAERFVDAIQQHEQGLVRSNYMLEFFAYETVGPCIPPTPEMLAKINFS